VQGDDTMKILEIDHCGKCYHCFEDDNYQMLCTEKRYTILREYPRLPADCPLPDLQEENLALKSELELYKSGRLRYIPKCTCDRCTGIETEGYYADDIKVVFGRSIGRCDHSER
jgi:hypothetical protein